MFNFSHSALKEGWDNPNVFQVCTLIEQRSAFTCRQKVGRGLRLCVNQNGERIEDKDINLLHVMANESFAEFAESLQREIEEETGMKFGILQFNLFTGMSYTETVEEKRSIDEEEAKEIVVHLESKGYISPEGQATPAMKVAIEQNSLELPPRLAAVGAVIAKTISAAPKVDAEVITGVAYTATVEKEKIVSHEEAEELIQYFEQKGYIGKKGDIKDTMKNALKNGTLDLPKKFEAARRKFEDIISKADKKPPLRDASKDVVVKLNKQAMLSEDFKETLIKAFPAVLLCKTARKS